MIDISIFSGRCDLCDTVLSYGADKLLEKYKIYAQYHILPLEVKEPKDLIPYYPYLVAVMYTDPETGGTIYLSEESFIDREEKEHIQWDLDDLLKYWRRCKRKQVPFDEQEALKEITWLQSQPREYQLELVRRVQKEGDKATIEGLHDNLHDYYRKELLLEMVNNGWDEDKAGKWVYGWSRWIKMSDEERTNVLTRKE